MGADYMLAGVAWPTSPSYTYPSGQVLFAWQPVLGYNALAHNLDVVHCYDTYLRDVAQVH
jgi:hypothetical protein